MFQSVIGELLEHVDDPSVKKVIASYNYSANHELNLKKMKSFTVGEIEKCALALGLKVRNDDDSKVYKNKHIFSDRLILKLESHFETTCDDCGEIYRNEIAAEYFPVHCFICTQGYHNCKLLTDKLATMDLGSLPMGFIWVCNGCQKNDPSNRELPNDPSLQNRRKFKTIRSMKPLQTKTVKKNKITMANLTRPQKFAHFSKNFNALMAPVGKLRLKAKYVLSTIQNIATNGAGSEQRRGVVIRVRNHAINFTRHYANILLCDMNVTIQTVHSLT